MWAPRSEDDLRVAAASGTLTEAGTHLEFKQSVEGTEAGRRKLAEELASLAVDGGVLIVGVVDTKHRNDPLNPDDALHPNPVAGEPERIEQIALTRCDPPLFVRTSVILSVGDASLGYLVVEVPQSPAAPHMVDGRYWGRGDTTKRQLTNRDVVDLHQRRRAAEERGARVLDTYMANDPLIVSSVQATAGHFFFTAEPLHARPDMLLDAEDNPRWQQWLADLISRCDVGDVPIGAAFAPDLGSAFERERRPEGWAATSGFKRPVEVGVDESHLFEVVLTVDGGVRIFCGRGTDLVHPNPDSHVRVMFDVMVAGLAFRLVRLAANVADATSYNGDWVLGLGGTGLGGARSYVQHEHFFPTAREFPDDTYRRTTRAPTAELQDAPESVVGRLVSPLLRVFGTESAPKVAVFMSPPRTSSSD